jgi:hypothetical protein
MKERLLTILAAAALLAALLQPALPAFEADAAALMFTTNAECHGGGQCAL